MPCSRAIIGLVLGLGLTACAHTPPEISQTQAALDAALAEQYAYRAGDYGVAGGSILELEAAIAADPDNPDLWAALGVARILAASAAGRQGDKPMEAVQFLMGGLEASAKALEINPDHAQALANHGTTLAITSLFTNDVEGQALARAEMVRAVELDPNFSTGRLRVFTTMNLPAEFRDRTQELSDLQWLLGVATSDREEGHLRLLLGDVYAEEGDLGLARAQYLDAAALAPTVDLANARLTSVAAGAVPASEITALRNQLGGNCAMCHGG